MSCIAARGLFNGDILTDPDDYGPGSIKVLHFPEAVRLRPAMYVGDVHDGTGLLSMIAFVVEDALVRRPTRVTVSLRGDGRVVVTDDGMPFPFAGPFAGSRRRIEADAQASNSIAIAARDALTMLDTHGLGWALPPVNALSAQFEARLWRDGDEHVIGFEEGQLVAPLARIGPAPSIAGIPRRGTEMSFLPSSQIFDAIAYDRRKISRRLRKLAKGHPAVTLALE